MLSNEAYFTSRNLPNSVFNPLHTMSPLNAVNTVN